MLERQFLRRKCADIVQKYFSTLFCRYASSLFALISVVTCSDAVQWATGLRYTQTFGWMGCSTVNLTSNWLAHVFEIF